MLFEIGDIDHDDLFVLTYRECLVPLLINTLRANANAIPHGLAPSDLKGLVRPALDRNRYPRGLVALGGAVEKIPRDRHWISPKLPLEEACRRALALGGGNGLKGPGYVDEVLLGSLARVVRPRAGIREGIKRLIQRDQPDNLGVRLGVELLESDLADDLVTEIAPCPGGGCLSGRPEHEGEAHGQAWKDPEESGTVAHDTSPHCLPRGHDRVGA